MSPKEKKYDPGAGSAVSPALATQEREDRGSAHASLGRSGLLPKSTPKPLEEDTEAPDRLRQILESPTYRRADRDLDFLSRNALRPARLQLEYLKAELALEESGVKTTIVVFGGTRIVELRSAEIRHERARRALEKSPDDPELQRALRVAERLLEKSRYYEVAREFGRRVGRGGRGVGDHRLIVMTGGGPGLMEAANRGAHEVGARSAGLNITLPREQHPNPYASPELSLQFRYFALRKMHFMLRARALVAFPGGFGTLDELFETLCLIQTRKLHPLPVVLVGERYWRRAIDLEYLADEGTIDYGDLDLFWYAETADEIWTSIERWYSTNGHSLFEEPESDVP